MSSTPFTTGIMSPPPLYRIGPVPSKGLALISTSSIPLGTPILSEPPFLTIPVSLPPTPAFADRIYTRLPPAKKAVFDSLCNAWPERGRVGVVQSNCIPVEERGWVGVWEKVGRANHACRANAMYSWDDVRGEKVIHALIDIPANTEITVPYLRTPSLPSPARRSHFLSALNFICSCPLCSLPPALQRVSDARRERFAVLEPLAASPGLAPRTRLGYLNEMLEGIVEDELWAEVPKVCWEGFEVCAAWGDGQAAKRWAEVAGREWRVGCGEGEGWKEAEAVRWRPEGWYGWRGLVQGGKGEEGLPGPWEGEKMKQRVERINELYGKKESSSTVLSKGQKKRARAKAKAKDKAGENATNDDNEKSLEDATEGLDIGDIGSR